MAAEARIAGAALLAYGVVLLATPLALRAACRLDFYDRPVGYKRHGRPTPYLGGTAVLLGVIAAGLVFADGFESYSPILLSALALWAVGTLDDRVLLGPAPRVLAAMFVALFLSRTGLGWDVFAGDVANDVLTVIWVVAVVNAFNLMDNLDGACSTVAAISSAGVAAIGAVQADYELAALAAALSGGALAFLRFNLAVPARIFLGDGGSMPLGFLVAATAIQATRGIGDRWSPVLVAAMCVGLVLFDTTLVILSRLRRRVPVLSGGRDHVTHRIFSRVASTRRVALALAGAQAALCGAALVATVSDDGTLALIFAASWMAVGLAALAGFEISYRGMSSEHLLGSLYSGSGEPMSGPSEGGA